MGSSNYALLALKKIRKKSFPGKEHPSNHSQKIERPYFHRYAHSVKNSLLQPGKRTRPPILDPHLKDSEEGDGERVEVRGRRPVGEVEGPAEELHPEQREDEDEEEEQKEQRDDGTHRAQQRDDQIAQGRPISGKKETER